MKHFRIPEFYKSPIMSRIKTLRKTDDPRKKDFKPTTLDFGDVVFKIARHFGFCYGVEHAIEIAYKTIEENPNKNIFLLSEMIHNPDVNRDLEERGVKFIMDNYGNRFVDWDEIKSNDVVIIPAFGTTIEIENLLKEKGIDTVSFNTTCPFVERVWNRAETIGKRGFTIIIHGKAKHEETRATFSHSIRNAPSLIIRNIEEAEFLAKVIFEEISGDEFYYYFNKKFSDEFDVKKDLKRIGVVNQTTMLASETQEISNYLRNTMIKKYGIEKIGFNFADTRDTLCYATNDNQSAIFGLLEEEADFAIVVGGYNSSNTSHLAELLEKKFKTYFISSANKILSDHEIVHYDLFLKKEEQTKNYIPQKRPVVIAVTCGASCPDSIVDEILSRILSFFDGTKSIDEVLDG